MCFEIFSMAHEVLSGMHKANGHSSADVEPILSQLPALMRGAPPSNSSFRASQLLKEGEVRYDNFKNRPAWDKKTGKAKKRRTRPTAKGTSINPCKREFLSAYVYWSEIVAGAKVDEKIRVDWTDVIETEASRLEAAYLKQHKHPLAADWKPRLIEILHFVAAPAAA